jgi:RNA polymerase sigma factor (TIGR02999 family)
METPQPNDITQWLLEWGRGNRAALDQELPVVYQELHKLARGYLQSERPDHTLQPTALIHEAYLRLIDQSVPQWESRKHFFGVAARAMRQILIEHARRHAAAKRGGGGEKISLEDATLFSQERAADLVALDDALTALAAFDERKARVIELRFFGGLTDEETGEAIGISVATVRRNLRLAEAWLQRELKK